MKTLHLFITLCCFPFVALAAGEAVHLDKAPIDLRDHASLQRGAKMFVNYCQGCHSLDFMRYNRMAKDIGLTDEKGAPLAKLVEANLINGSGKITDTFTSALQTADGAKWFGKAPPDLTLTARSRGSDWIYSYLRGFYVDEGRPWGVNNTVYKDVAMPDVLANLRGTQVMADEHLQLLKSGSMSPREFDNAVGDLVNFLTYVAEPAKLERLRLGIWVLLFLGVLFVFAYLLKKEYWKDVH